MLRLTVLLTIGVQSIAFGQIFSGQVFEIAENFTTDKCEVFAECDCCSSDIFFLSADKFCFVSRCMSGDSYFKGTYTVNSDKLTLTFDKKYIDEITDEDYNVVKLETKEKDLKLIEFDITKCGQKIRLMHPTTLEWKNGARYGIKQEREKIEELKTSKVLKLLSE